VTNFDDLKVATGVCVDIKLGPEPIIFNGTINLSGKQLTFTCPTGDCVLDGDSMSKFFNIWGYDSSISFDGITFQKGQAKVSPK
jgi:hypothetical protein